MRVLLACMLIGALSTLAQETQAPPGHDPFGVVDGVLKGLQRPHLKAVYKTNDNLLYATILCKDVAERNAVYDAFRSTPKYAMSAQRTPPSVCVVQVYHAPRFQVTATRAALEDLLRQAGTVIRGKVESRDRSGVLVSIGERVVYVVDVPGLGGIVDKDPFARQAYQIGDHEYTTTDGALRHCWKYTCSVEVAADYWRPLASDAGAAETIRRTRQRME